MSRYTITITVDVNNKPAATKTAKVLEKIISTKVKDFSVDVTKRKAYRNKSRAERLSEAAGIRDNAVSAVEELAEEMNSWYENLPENLQGSDKGSRIEEAAQALESIKDELEGVDFDSVEFVGMYD